MARRTTRVPPPEGMRYCSRCKANRPLEEFGAYPSYADGSDPYCREHRKEARNESRGKKRVRPVHYATLDKLENFEGEMPLGFLLRVCAMYLERDGYVKFAARLREANNEMDSDVCEAPDEDSGS